MASNNNKISKGRIDNIEEREKALADALDQIQKQYGKGSIMKLGDASAQMNIDTISTGRDLWPGIFW